MHVSLRNHDAAVPSQTSGLQMHQMQTHNIGQNVCLHAWITKSLGSFIA